MTTERIVYDALNNYIKKNGVGPLTPTLVEITKLPQNHISSAVRAMARAGVIGMGYRSYGTIKILKPFSEFRPTALPPQTSRITRGKKHDETKNKIRQIIQRCANEHKPVPIGEKLGEMVGIGRRSANDAVQRLVRDGVIKMLPRQYSTIKIMKPITLKDSALSAHAPVNSAEHDRDRVYNLIRQAVALRGGVAPNLPTIVDTLSINKTRASKLVNDLIDDGRITRERLSYSTIKVADASSRATPKAAPTGSNGNIISILAVRRAELVIEKQTAFQIVERVDKLIQVLDETSAKLAEI